MKEKCIDCEYEYDTQEMTKTDDGDLICDECKDGYCDCGNNKDTEEEVCGDCR